jgi:D-alanyl-D-alanine dipeptidase
MRVLEKSSDPKQRAEWEPKLNPQNLGFAYPGATPHSAGNACDIVLLDSQGKESFDAGIGKHSPHSSIPAKQASILLDEALTNDTVGARRLNYELWHYEWGGTTSCRCKYPDCGNKFWPPVGTPAGCTPH